jgi:pimeloyl-ACP methyl ester carboxylesterase
MPDRDKMPWIEQDGNRIYYVRLDAAGTVEATSSAANTAATKRATPPPVLLHHGLSQRADDWAKAGWLEVFGDRPVYALDALGHGRSDRPQDRAVYSVEKRAETILQLADTEHIDRFAFFGFSMGGRVGFELATSNSDRVERLIVGGMHGLKPSIDQRNLERRTAVLRSPKWRLVERAVGARREDGRDNDPEALALSTDAVLDWAGAEDRLPALNIPSMLFCGTQDSLLEYARHTAGLIPGCTFTELPSTTHAASFYSSTTARNHVRTFLST